MKLGIDISQIVYKGTGVARFTLGLTKTILQYDDNNDWIFFFSSLRQSFDEALIKNIREKFQLRSYKVPQLILDLLWNKVHRLNIEYFIGDVDWFITSDWTEPPVKARKTTIVHDLAFLRYPETVNQTIKQVQRRRLYWVEKESDLIFVDSLSTKHDLLEFLRIEEKRIWVNYPGVDVDRPSEEEISKTLEKYSLNTPFILTVGKIEPRKNLKRLITAFRQLKQNDIQLVIAGPRGWENLNSEELHNVRLLGYIPDSELFSLYRAALFFIFPSLWEGFGYPVIEAMKCGCPTAISNISSLKEIGEGAALLFDPMNTDEISQALATMIQDQNIRADLIIKGEEKSKLFTWERYYNKMMKTFGKYL